MDETLGIVTFVDYRLVTVRGDIDETSVASFGAACTYSGPVVVDLLRCPYMDSSGLSALIACNKAGTIALVLTPDCRIYRIFSITRLLEHFLIAATSQAAVALIAGSARSEPIIEDPDN